MQMTIAADSASAAAPIYGVTSPVTDRSLWGLDPSLTFLNHGSYGACLREVMNAQQAIRSRMESDPVRFFKVDLERLFDDVRRSLGQLCNCPPEAIGPCMNATVAIATIFANTPLKAGDEILVTDHEYSSGINELNRLAPRVGAKVVTAKIPFPVRTPQQVVEAVLSAITSRTRLVLLSHITTTTSLIFPVKPIVDELNRRNIDVLVDGAHTPGQIEVDIRAINPTYYVGSLHKWLCAPKGTGFLYVRPDRQAGFRTVVLSSRADKVRPDRPLFLRDFDYMGTADYTPLLTIPATLSAMQRIMPGGWGAIRKHNHELIVKAREIVCQAAGLTPPAPESMIGSMASLILPAPDAGLPTRTTLYDDPLQDALVERHAIQVPVWAWNKNPELRVMRISAQLYNCLDQYKALGASLAEELARERVYRQTA